MTILVAIGEEQRSERLVSVATDLETASDDTLVALHVVPEDDFEAHERHRRDPRRSDGKKTTGPIRPTRRRTRARRR